jgi:putative transposase
MPRQARLDAPGTLHHVMVRGIERGKIVEVEKDRIDFVRRMGETAEKTDTTIYAWSLLSNHAHILLRSGSFGVAGFMRRFLTGYAVVYNRRHGRHGHVFQNRYKSIVCEEDAYFRELVRYIHLNPLRANLVQSLSELDSYAWSGHSVLMGTVKHDWQDRDYVLGWFGTTGGTGKKRYREYVDQGISQGRRDDLVGGGLVRSLGGWSEVLSLRRSGSDVESDSRVLGTGEFVRQVVQEAEEKVRRQFPFDERRERAIHHIEELCAIEGVGLEEMRGGVRRGKVPQVRSRLANDLVGEYGLSLAEVGRQLGVTTSAVSRILSRK